MAISPRLARQYLDRKASDNRIRAGTLLTLSFSGARVKVHYSPTNDPRWPYVVRFSWLKDVFFVCPTYNDAVLFARTRLSEYLGA